MYQLLITKDAVRNALTARLTAKGMTDDPFVTALAYDVSKFAYSKVGHMPMR